jgi:histone-lysine N-methyltransferase SETMAR
MDNSMCHNGHTFSQKFDQGSIQRAPNTPYSPDISPCGFWLFGTLKHQMKDRDFQSQQEILQAITKRWDDLTFAEVQSVFWECTERLTWVAGNNGEYYPSEKHQFKKWLSI